MSIEVISAWGNEIFLAPFFFKHYSYADRITILFDQFWKADEQEIFKHRNEFGKPGRVYIVPITYHGADGGIDEMVKSRTISSLYKQTDCDYCICVDADEFVFGTPEELQSGYDFAKVRLFDVFRHVSEHDLDINKTIQEQRRHGFLRWMYNKPIVLKAGLNLRFDSGQHAIFENRKRHAYNQSHLPPDLLARYKPNGFIGTHWCFADLNFCLERRARKAWRHGVRFTDYNGITKDSIIAECKQHENDPQVFE